MNARLIISLDFELMWGVRDHRTVADYGDAVLGVRSVLPAMLKRFADARIRATWATVGLLFARTRDDMLDHAPRLRPAYANASLSPYAAIEKEIGRDEAEDPLHYGASLVDRIADTEGQEIATHTFSHYYCLEDGQSLEAFDADLKAARSIAAAGGHQLTSIVFPRNQMTDAHIACCQGNGITCFRGNPDSFAYRPRSGKENTPLVRAIRLLDGIAPVSGSPQFSQAKLCAGLVDVPASRFLRPWNPRFPAYSRLHVDHVLREMSHAAKTGQSYHLWWHPHNMGRNQERSLAQLDRVIETFVRLRDSHGMQSFNMADIALSDLN